MVSTMVRSEEVRSENEMERVCDIDELNILIGLHLCHFGCPDVGGRLHWTTIEEVQKFWLGYRIMCGIIVVLFGIEIMVLAL